MQKLVCLMGLVLLSGCAGGKVDQGKVDLSAQVACGVMEAADTGFQVYSQKHPDEENQHIEALAYAGVHELCKPPYTVDIQTLIAKASKAATQIYSLMK